MGIATNSPTVAPAPVIKSYNMKAAFASHQLDSGVCCSPMRQSQGPALLDAHHSCRQLWALRCAHGVLSSCQTGTCRAAYVSGHPA